jgi:hypothetical protein
MQTAAQREETALNRLHSSLVDLCENFRTRKQSWRNCLRAKSRV